MFITQSEFLSSGNVMKIQYVLCSKPQYTTIRRYIEGTWTTNCFHRRLVFPLLRHPKDKLPLSV